MEEVKSTLRQQYEAALEVERQARALCYGKDGQLLALIKGPDGRPQPNPYLPEWHRAVTLVRELARELGIEERPSDRSLLQTTLNGSQDEQLKTLAAVLADAIDHTSGHGKAALCRIYLDTLRDIREVSGLGEDGGVVDAIIASASGANARRFSVV